VRKIMRFAIWLEGFSRTVVKRSWKFLVSLLLVAAVWKYWVKLVSLSETVLVGYLLLTVLWIVAVVGVFLLRRYLPETKETKRGLVKIRPVSWAPLVAVTTYSLIVALSRIPRPAQWAWWVWVTIAAVAILALWFVFSKYKPKDKAATKAKEKKDNLSWLPDKYMATVIAVAILSLNVAIWKTMPSLWNILLNNDWWRLIILNVCFWLFLTLQTIRVKDAKGVDKVNPVAGKVAGWIGIVLMLAVASPTWDQIKVRWEKYSQQRKEEKEKAKKESGNSISSNFSLYDDVPSDIAFPIIAGEESGGKQFKEDEAGNIMKDENGKPIVLRGVENEHDIGYLQINEVVWADLIKENPKIDIYGSKEGNLELAEIIRSKKGYQPWYRSQSRWGPKLKRWKNGQHGQDTRGLASIFPDLPEEMDAPVGAPGKPVLIPSGYHVDWSGSEGPFLVINDRGKSAKYGVEGEIDEDIPPPSRTIQFQSLGDKVVKAKLKWRRV